MRRKSKSFNLETTDHLDHIHIDGRIILKWILNKYFDALWTCGLGQSITKGLSTLQLMSRFLTELT
jgi:hypothetical protein